MSARRMFALLLGLCLLGCKPAPPEHLPVAGSHAMFVFMGPVVEAFKKDNPHVDVVSEAGGATAGVIAVKRGAIDVSTLTRDLKPKEDDQRIRNFLVAKDAVLVVVHPSNPVSAITMAQAREIMSATLTNWKALGGNEVPINLVVRDGSSPAQMTIREMLIGGDEVPSGRVAPSIDEVIAIVKADPNALGYISLRGLRPEVRALNIDGVAPSRLTILSGRYPLSRSFYLSIYGVPSAPIAERFVEFTLGKKGQDALAAQGLIPVY